MNADVGPELWRVLLQLNPHGGLLQLFTKGGIQIRIVSELRETVSDTARVAETAVLISATIKFPKGLGKEYCIWVGTVATVPYSFITKFCGRRPLADFP